MIKSPDLLVGIVEGEHGVDLTHEVTLRLLQRYVCSFHEERPSMADHNKQPLVTETCLIGEAAELIEVARYQSFDGDFFDEKYREELADIMIYLMVLADNQGVDLVSEVVKKTEANKKRFPVEDFQGTAEDYPTQYMNMKLKTGERKPCKTQN